MFWSRAESLLQPGSAAIGRRTSCRSSWCPVFCAHEGPDSGNAAYTSFNHMSRQQIITCSVLCTRRWMPVVSNLGALGSTIPFLCDFVIVQYVSSFISGQQSPIFPLTRIPIPCLLSVYHKSQPTTQLGTSVSLLLHRSSLPNHTFPSSWMVAV